MKTIEQLTAIGAAAAESAQLNIDYSYVVSMRSHDVADQPAREAFARAVRDAILEGMLETHPVHKQLTPINDGGYAFPVPTLVTPTGEVMPASAYHNCNGITLRDYFAAKALMGVEACYDNQNDWQTSHWCHEAAKHCYQIADALLKAREVQP